MAYAKVLILNDRDFFLFVNYCLNLFNAKFRLFLDFTYLSILYFDLVLLIE